MPYFTVIIPAFDTARYVDRCLRSLQAQTFRDWEAVCSDDGSMDGTGAKMDRFAAEDPRFRVLHLPHAGVCVARNEAILRCSRARFLTVKTRSLSIFISMSWITANR